MPSTKKTLHFVSSALVTAKSVALLGFGMSRKWSETTIECARSGSNFFNGSAVVTLQLFDGNMDRIFCPTFGGSADFQGNFSRILKSHFTQITRFFFSLIYP